VELVPIALGGELSDLSAQGFEAHHNRLDIWPQSGQTAVTLRKAPLRSPHPSRPRHRNPAERAAALRFLQVGRWHESQRQQVGGHVAERPSAHTHSVPTPTTHLFGIYVHR
jgi:hypothetical protein